MADRLTPQALNDAVQAVRQTVETPTDAALLDRFVTGGDGLAVEALVRRHGPMVWAACRAVLRHRQDAEEVLQATFLQLVRKAGSIANRESIGGWLHTVACRAAAKAARYRRREKYEPLPEVAGCSAGSDEAADAAERARLLHQEIERLPPDQREVVILCHLEGLKRPDAAARLGVPVGTIDSRLARALERLRTQLARRGVTGAGVLPVFAGGLVPERVVAAAVRVALGPSAAVPLGVAALAGRSIGFASPGPVLPALAAIILGAATFALVAAVGWVGLPPRVGGDPPPAAGANPPEPAVPAVKPEVLTANNVFRRDLPVGASGVAFGPNGRLALGGWMEPGTDGVKTAPGRLWNGNPSAEPVDAGPHGPGPVAFRNDGTPVFLVLPAGDRWSLLLWDMDHNAQLAEIPLPGPGAAQVRAALSADGTLAAATVAGADDQAGHTLVWRLPAAAGEPVRELHRWDHAATALAFSPNNELVAVGHATGSVSVRSVADGREMVPAIRTGHATVLAVAFGRNFWKRLAPPTGPDFLLAAGGKGGHLGVWDLSTGDKLHALPGSAFDVHAVAFSPDGTRLASVGRNRPIVWDVASGRESARINHPNEVSLNFRNWMAGVAFSPDGRRLAITSVAKFGLPGGLDVVELAENSAVRSLWGLNAPVEKVFLSPRGNWVVGLSAWQLGIWEAASGRLVGVVEVEPGLTADNAALKFDADEREAVFAAGRRAVKLDLATGREVASWRLPVIGLNDNLAALPDGNWLLFRSERETPGWGEIRRPQSHRTYDLLPGGQIRVRYTLADLSGVQRAVLSGDGRLLVIGANPDFGDGRLRPLGFDGLTGQPVPLSIQDSINGARGSPAGSRMVFPRDVEGIRTETIVFDCESGRRLATHAGGWDAIDDNGRVLAGVVWVKEEAEYRVIEVIDARSGALLKRFDTGGARVNGQLSINGRFVAWGQADGLVRLAALNLRPDQPRW